jgi:uncharacterized protein (DUF885 family)
MTLRKALVPAVAAAALVLVPATRMAAEETADARFETVARDYIEQLLRLEPERATALGDHRYDDRLNDYTLEGVKRARALSEETLKRLAPIPVGRLSRPNNVDYRILKTRLEYSLFRADVLKEHAWNPLRYNTANAIYALLARDFAPLETRVKNVGARLRQIPAVLRAARANLGNPPLIHTETAILQNKGAIALIRDQVGAAAAQARAGPELAAAQAAAIAALEDYGKWLEHELLPRSNGEFRLGDEKFRRKLAFDLEADLTKEEILRRAEADLRRTQRTLYEAAVPLFKRHFTSERELARIGEEKFVIRAVLDRLAETRPTNDTIVALATESLEKTTRFVREHALVTVPDEPVKIIVMPEFNRGVSVAYCSAAPPLEPQGETFYAIAPTPRDWPPQRVDSFFREYNNYMVEELTIHEAMPGHYLQLAHAARFRAPTLVRKVFGSGPFVEGWAVYAEQLMAEKGYGGAEVRIQQLKMRIRAIINAILDQKIHTAGMNERDAMRLMMEEGFQEEGEAAGKWRRAAISSGQLSTYYVGVLEVGDIRRDYEARATGAVDYRKMHDAMLSFGAPAPKYVREMLGL